MMRDFVGTMGKPSQCEMTRDVVGTTGFWGRASVKGSVKSRTDSSGLGMIGDVVVVNIKEFEVTVVSE